MSSKQKALNKKKGKKSPHNEENVEYMRDKNKGKETGKEVDE